MLKVVLVDDNYRAVEGLMRYLPWDGIGCTCVGTASNGKEALELAYKLLPNVVVTDVRMPVMDGVELCRHLHEKFPGITLIVLSAYNDFEYAKQLIPYGVKNYFLKPIDDEKIQELAEMLHKISKESLGDAHGISTLLALSWEGRLFDSLKLLDEDALNLVMEEIRNEQQNLSFHAVMDLASRLLHYLFSFIRRQGFPDLLECSQDEILYQLKDAVSKEQAVCFVAKTYQSFYTAMKNRKSTDTSHLAAMIKAYIHKTYAAPELSTGSLARKFHISQSYLCHIFKDNERCNINAYITGYRIEKAHDLLLNSDRSIVEISNLVGYPDPHYFTKVYKKIKGISPSEMRKLRLGRE